MKELLERVKAVTGPDRELDIDLMIQLGGMRDVFGDRLLFDRGNDGYWSTCENDDRNTPLPSPTASLDDALALLELHRNAIGCYGWQVELDDEPVHDPFYARLHISTGHPTGDGPGGSFLGCGVNAPLAVVEALLMALLAAQEATPDKP